MAHIVEITDFTAPELDVYARLTEAQLLNREEPAKGLFIAESPKVIERALDAGYQSLMVDGSTRYNELKRKMNGISNTMLAKSLKEMEDDGLVTRTEYMEVPIRVEYAITEKAKALGPILVQLAQWAASNA